ncbi:hypothetical protein CRENBAI_021898 [Crenichthys baileyi]|uniref:Uncharacterized protein n=1 Tax=Crenichthys baileyi TaxID=28760 RepID=A0AAV9SR25_9TELE
MILTKKLGDIFSGQISGPGRGLHTDCPLLLCPLKFHLVADNLFVVLLDAGLSGSDHPHKLELGEPAAHCGVFMMCFSFVEVPKAVYLGLLRPPGAEPTCPLLLLDRGLRTPGITLATPVPPDVEMACGNIPPPHHLLQCCPVLSPLLMQTGVLVETPAPVSQDLSAAFTLTSKSQVETSILASGGPDGCYLPPAVVAVPPSFR